MSLICLASDESAGSETPGKKHCKCSLWVTRGFLRDCLKCLNLQVQISRPTPRATAVRCGFDSRSIRGAGSQCSKFGDRRQSFDLKSPSVRLRVSSALPREMTVRSRAWGVLSLEPNVPSASTYVSSAEISVLRKAARVRCLSTPVPFSVP